MHNIQLERGGGLGPLFYKYWGNEERSYEIQFPEKNVRESQTHIHIFSRGLRENKYG